MATRLTHDQTNNASTKEAFPQREITVSQELASIHLEVVELQSILAELKAQFRNASFDKPVAGEHIDEFERIVA